MDDVSIQDELLTINKTRLLVYHRNYMKSINLIDISYICKIEKSVFVFSNGKEKYLINKTLAQIESRINPHKFFRVNRAYIISIGSISRVEPYFGSRLIVFLNYDKALKIIVSREKVAEFKLWLGE